MYEMVVLILSFHANSGNFMHIFIISVFVSEKLQLLLLLLFFSFVSFFIVNLFVNSIIVSVFVSEKLHLLLLLFCCFLLHR